MMLLKKDISNAKIKNIEDKIPSITNSATNAALNAKINKVKNKVPSITNLILITNTNIWFKPLYQSKLLF